MTLKARVRAGRLVVDEPTELPEGTVVELMPLDPGHWLDNVDRQPARRPSAESTEDGAATRLVSPDEILTPGTD